MINPATNTVSTTVPVGTLPGGVAVNPTGTDVYVANAGSNTVSVINPANNTVSTTVPVGSTPVELAVSPTGPQAGDIYVSTQGSGTVSVIS